MGEVIRIGALEIRFLQSKDATGGSLDMFEMTVPPAGKMPVPHYHETWDETVYGLEGVTTFQIDGRTVDVGPGETAFIGRGIVHGFSNRTSDPVTCLIPSLIDQNPSIRPKQLCAVGAAGLIGSGQ